MCHMWVIGLGGVRGHDVCTWPLHLYDIQFAILLKFGKNNSYVYTIYVYEFGLEISIAFQVISIGH